MICIGRIKLGLLNHKTWWKKWRIHRKIIRASIIFQLHGTYFSQDIQFPFAYQFTGFIKTTTRLESQQPFWVDRKIFQWPVFCLKSNSQHFYYQHPPLQKPYLIASAISTLFTASSWNDWKMEIIVLHGVVYQVSQGFQTKHWSLRLLQIKPYSFTRFKLKPKLLKSYQFKPWIFKFNGLDWRD